MPESALSGTQKDNGRFSSGRGVEPMGTAGGGLSQQPEAPSGHSRKQLQCRTGDPTAQGGLSKQSGDLAGQPEPQNRNFGIPTGDFSQKVRTR